MSDTDIIHLDVRGLQPPEPLERVLDALDWLTPGKRIVMLIDREPLPLYRILDRNGYRYHATMADTGTVTVDISLAA